MTVKKACKPFSINKLTYLFSENGRIMKRHHINRSQAMVMAWILHRQSPQLSFGQCMAAAWKTLRLYAALRDGTVRFSFRKENGELRQALGTLVPDLFVAPPKNSDYLEGMTLVRYFDVEKNAIRSCRADRLVQVAA
jgi:hypothetical protein